MTEESIEKRTPILGIFSTLLVILAIGAFFTFQFITTPPVTFTSGTTFEITEGLSVRAIAQKAGEEGLVRSDFLLYIILTKKHDPTAIFAGEYIFDTPGDVYTVAEKLASKEIAADTVSVTFPEGITLQKMAEIGAASLSEFNAEEYLALTTGKEGYLFPETYFVPPTYTAADVVLLQEATYEELMESLRADIESSPLTEEQVLILASIVEREANDEVSMGYVAGIYLNRMEIGMPLQADASIEYVLDTPLNELPEGQLATELRETDSPYNTYLNPGLPPTPIGNPGQMSIEAVVYPTHSDYLYYITDNDGDFHYAQTLTEHNANVERYLR